MRRALVLLLLLVPLAGCGGSKDAEKRSATATPAPLPTDPIQVADAWAKAVRANDMGRASALFALPSIVSNGTPPLELRSLGDVRVFNSSFPCGAILLRARKLKRNQVLATYTLTDRAGAPAPCGSGVGARAGVRFTIVDGRITRWIRADPEAGPARTPTPEL